MTLHRFTAIAGLLVAATISMSACTNTPAPGPTAAPSAPPPSTSVPTATVTAPPTTIQPPVTTTTTTSAPITAKYDAARVQWQAGATAISAMQGKYWTQAAADLTAGETTDSNPTGYAAAVTALKQLVSLPDAMQTPQQNAEFHADINALNTFFHTPGLYS
jgi:hypothetical protein